ncbi:MAG: DNA primase DnaG [Candidatus Njordarchaeales archaeon]
MGNEVSLPGYAKYIIHLNMHVEGIVEKHDIIGAIFGQLDGLLPSSMDLQELQRIGKIDRINVKVSHKEGKTYAQITIPCNMTKLEVAILAAALETIDRVGPSKAETKLVKIEDIRKVKREAIVRRAAEILRMWDDLVAPENADITRRVEEEARKHKLIYIGPEKLPAGPAVKTSDEIIIVEGRADVINLLKHGFDNAIAVEGTKIPQTIIELSKKKITTAFVDGDRSGLLILKELLQVADIDYIARAPKGKEVQELSLKEIKKALSRRIPVNNMRISTIVAVEELEKILEKPLEAKHIETGREEKSDQNEKTLEENTEETP